MMQSSRRKLISTGGITDEDGAPVHHRSFRPRPRPYRAGASAQVHRQLGLRYFPGVLTELAAPSEPGSQPAQRFRVHPLAETAHSTEFASSSEHACAKNEPASRVRPFGRHTPHHSCARERLDLRGAQDRPTESQRYGAYGRQASLWRKPSCVCVIVPLWTLTRWRTHRS